MPKIAQVSAPADPDEKRRGQQPESNLGKPWPMTRRRDGAAALAHEPARNRHAHDHLAHEHAAEGDDKSSAQKKLPERADLARAARNPTPAEQRAGGHQPAAAVTIDHRTHQRRHRRANENFSRAQAAKTNRAKRPSPRSAVSETRSACSTCETRKSLGRESRHRRYTSHRRSWLAVSRRKC